MLIKTFTLYFLRCVVVIASSLAANQSTPRDAAAFQPDISREMMAYTGQIVNRTGKSDRLSVKPVQHRANDKAPARISAGCRPPIDVRGRCFANLKVSRTAT